MKMLVTGNIDYYGDFEIGKIYDIEMNKGITREDGNIKYFTTIDDEKDGIIFIDCKECNTSFEYENVKNRIEIFKDDKELAHYLIDNVKRFAENVVNIKIMFSN